jgi:uroporphyrinogen-III decarboxylase
MHKYIFPRYEEFWSILRTAGKHVLFMSDGNMTRYADDVIACGARGIISEPSTDYKKIARDHGGENLFLAGEGDNRILMRNNPEEIKAMVESMIETSKMTGGYVMCIGNHIPWNVPPPAIKLYLDVSRERAVR